MSCSTDEKSSTSYNIFVTEHIFILWTECSFVLWTECSSVGGTCLSADPGSIIDSARMKRADKVQHLWVNVRLNSWQEFLSNSWPSLPKFSSLNTSTSLIPRHVSWCIHIITSSQPPFNLFFACLRYNRKVFYYILHNIHGILSDITKSANYITKCRE